MSKTLANILIITLVFAGSYFWYEARAICPVPIHYMVGQLDAEFGISEMEALAAITEAESMWEDATGQNLFTLKDGGMPINFVFDERQQFTNAAEDFGHKLDEARVANKGLEEEYNQIVTQYDTASAEYNRRVQSYEQKLSAYNQEVTSWNEKGGAPQEVFDDLNQRQRELDEEQRAIDTLRQNLNVLVDEINQLSDQANNAVDTYNEQVNRYNETFAEGDEFTQGDYRGDHINIYQFSTKEELVLVLAHELGHALGIEHVDNEASVMFRRM